jgi:transcriptional regulator with XRE-family HTH domain
LIGDGTVETICQRVKTLRQMLELNQVEFAKKIGVTNAHISKIEKGKTVPSAALIKLICKEFGISEQWLADGKGPVGLEEVLQQTEYVMMSITDRLNKIRTRDVMPIRSRVAQLEELFVEVLDFIGVSSEESVQTKYFDICYKVFYHLNAYLTFYKKSIQDKQLHIFPFPDDLIKNLERDIGEYEDFFKSLLIE